MTQEEVIRVISLINGTAQLVVKLLYGSGLRIAAEKFQGYDPKL